jgi:lysozyme family protein
VGRVKNDGIVVSKANSLRVGSRCMNLGSFDDGMSFDKTYKLLTETLAQEEDFGISEVLYQFELFGGHGSQTLLTTPKLVNVAGHIQVCQW